MGLTVPVSCHRGLGFWHLPSGLLMPHFPVPSPAPPSPPAWEPCNIKLIAPLDALEPGPQGVGGAANHGLGGAGTLGAQGGGGGGQEPRWEAVGIWGIWGEDPRPSWGLTCPRCPWENAPTSLEGFQTS